MRQDGDPAFLRFYDVDTSTVGSGPDASVPLGEAEHDVVAQRGVRGVV